jgi:MOSC domain-containing protein YiiM
MTNEELYKMAIEPQLKSLTESVKKLEHSNTQQHVALGAKVTQVFDRVFTTNGEKALTVVAQEHSEEIETLKGMAHHPRMGRQRLATDGVKLSGAAALFMFLNKAFAFLGEHWHIWFPQGGGNP